MIPHILSDRERRRPMWNVSGITGAAPIWQEVMIWLHRTQPRLWSAVSTRFFSEPERTECCFLTDTQPGKISQGLARGATRILSPRSWDDYSTDPDIPVTHKRLVFEDQENILVFLWQLDGKDIGLATQPRLSVPTSGKHRLSLVDTYGHPIDTIRFEVRGTIEK